MKDRLLAHPNVRFIWELIEIYLDKRIPRASAQLAYYVLLTLFPILIVLSAILGMLPLPTGDILDRIFDSLPEDIGALLAEYLIYVQNNQSFGLLSGGIIMTITSSSAAFRGLMDIFGEIFGERVQGGVIGTLFSLLLSVLLIVLVFGGLLVVLLGDYLLDVIQFLLDVPVLHYGWRMLQILVPFGLAFLFLALLYRVTARTPRHKRMVLPGALLAAVALVAASNMFSTFLEYSNRYYTIYGSLASVIILMIWLFLCCNILILGNTFNFLRARHRDLYGTGRLPRFSLRKH